MKITSLKICHLVILFSITGHSILAQKKGAPPLPVSKSSDGHLQYIADEKGNRIPDFSYCGYMAGEVSIPEAPVRVVVPFIKGDATIRIQSALDYIASLPTDKNGLRGAVLLQKGIYEVWGSLMINASGVVLRGSGKETVLKGMGTDRATLLRIAGKNDKEISEAHTIEDVYLPVNARTLKLSKAGIYKAGDKVFIRRPSTLQWLQQLGTVSFGGGISALGWKPGERDIVWDRQVISTEGNSVTLDAPLTTALDTAYGGGTIASYEWKGRITQVGAENLTMDSWYDVSNPKDEAHRWMAITIENSRDAWVRQVTFKHFAGSAVNVLETASRITVEDCKSLEPVSEIGGQRRYTFLTTGGQALFQRLYSEYGYHDFATGFCAPGPNAFVQCDAFSSLNFSGAIDSWASGVLFDIVNIDGNAIRFGNRGQDGQGAGWTAANSMLWQCTAAKIDSYKPPGAQNWAFGNWAQFDGDGYWNASNESVDPRSFYYAQLADRLGKNMDDRALLFENKTNATSSPSVKQAEELVAWSVKPRATMPEWIDHVIENKPISIATNNARTIDQIGIKKTTSIKFGPEMHVEKGWLVRGSAIITGSRQNVPWWTGGIHGKDLQNAKPAITRFVPGLTGKGLTDDLDELTDTMVKKHQAGIEQNYALWYDRRRDDHERIRRMDGEVWAPFYELPFARTGKGLAWDGLSKYDLTKYNTWYWGRLQQYASLADQKGLLLVHQNYFQHNIIEAGAHYADFPWRTANNINNTGFPEPVPYAGDKRIFMAELFYDVENPARRALHKAYIRQCLNNFKGNTGVIQLTGEEFTGPLHFVQFWIDVIAEWEKETGKNVLTGLSTTKDVQDAILADPVRAKSVDIIDVRYWHYQKDSMVYAPEGGKNLAPRQWARLLKPKGSSFDQVYRAVKEYRLRFPGKAVMYSGDSYDKTGWAVFMAGGSLASIPVIEDTLFLKDASAMQPMQLNNDHSGNWMLGAAGKGYIIYAQSPETIALDLTNERGSFTLNWIDPSTGLFTTKKEIIESGKITIVKNPRSGSSVLWVRKNN